MTLNSQPIYPVASGYVLRLHRDAQPAEGFLMGRIQHVSSGDWADFANGTELLEWLVLHGRHMRTQSIQAEDKSHERDAND
jgi:hypothetical protein